MTDIKKEIIKKIKKYTILIKEEYKNQIPHEINQYHNLINNWEEVVNIEETKTINLFIHNGKFYFPKSSDKILDLLKKIPGYGTNKNHRNYDNKNLILNDNTFFDYFIHLFLTGKNSKEYYLENLLHETMHFCGSSGNTALDEGFTELKTRELAQTYNLTTSGCGYPKEVNIAYKLQKIFGKEICDKLTFTKNYNEKLQIIEKNLGKDMVVLYNYVFFEMQKEFHNKYYNYKFQGITGIFKKIIKYGEINYTQIEIFLDNIIENKNKIKYKKVEIYENSNSN